MESFHRSVSPDSMAALRKRALQAVIDEELHVQAGERLGLTASDAEVDRGIVRARRASKSRAEFDRAFPKAGTSMAELRREVRRALTIRKAYDHEVAAVCQVGTDEAQQFYIANRERFVVPEQLHLFAITIGVEPSASGQQWGDASARAAEVWRQLRAGASFEEMARRHSTDPSRDTGGDMGLFHRGTLNDEFEAAARGLKPGDISDVIQTLYGYHVIRVSEIRPPQQRSWADMSAEIRKDLTTKRCAEMTDAWTARLRARARIEFADAAGAPNTLASSPRAGQVP